MGSVWTFVRSNWRLLFWLVGGGAVAAAGIWAVVTYLWPTNQCAPLTLTFGLAALISIILLLVPILILVNAEKQVRKLKEDDKFNRKKSPPIRRPEKEESEFHLSEFTSLKSEIAEMVKATAANFQYAVIASAGVFTWIVTADEIRGHTPRVPLRYEIIPYGIWLPFLLSTLLFSLSVGLYVRISEMAIYLRRLEDALGSRELGWEKMFSGHPGILGPLYAYGWILLLGGDWALALLLPCFPPAHS
jgi:hypothetical protein